MTDEAPQIINSPGNIFADLGVPDPEIMKLRAELIVKIRHTIDESGNWTPCL